jgi:hypothetical protein
LIWVLIVIGNSFIAYAPSIDDVIVFPQGEHALDEGFEGDVACPNGCTITYRSNRAELGPGGSVRVDADGSMHAANAPHTTSSGGTEAEDVSQADIEPEHEHYEEAGRITRQDIELDEARNTDLGAPNGDMQAERAKRAKIGEVVAFDAEGVSRRSGVLKIAKASRIEVRDGILTHVVEFQGSGIRFHVGAAQDVLNGCVLLKDVWDSDFTVSDREGSIHLTEIVGRLTLAVIGDRQCHLQMQTSSGSLPV